MAIFQSQFAYTLTPGGTNEFTLDTEIPNGGASGDATDDTITPGESVPVNFTDPANNGLDGNYIYIGTEPGLPGYVAEDAFGNHFLFSNQQFPPGQVFNIQEIDVTVCFLPGTRIACPDGERAVEEFKIGDLVLTADGRAVSVKWLGRQTVSVIFGLPEGRQPICVSSGALGNDLPVRDLRLTATHALLIDGVLVHAGALVNGTTITRIPRRDLGERLVVYHIETENHEIVLAEGTPAETFIDNVTRASFDNYAEYETLYGPAPAAMEELQQARAMSSRQVPAHIRARIAAVAARAVERDQVA
jgi:hypothetical protein